MAMALFLTDLVLSRQKCRLFDVEHKGGNKHVVCGISIFETMWMVKLHVILKSR